MHHSRFTMLSAYPRSGTRRCSPGQERLGDDRLRQERRGDRGTERVRRVRDCARLTKQRHEHLPGLAIPMSSPTQKPRATRASRMSNDAGITRSSLQCPPPSDDRSRACPTKSDTPAVGRALLHSVYDQPSRQSVAPVRSAWPEIGMGAAGRGHCRYRLWSPTQPPIRTLTSGHAAHLEDRQPMFVVAAPGAC